MIGIKRRRIYSKIYRKIKEHNTIVIARHIGADPDALGSQFALRDIIKNKFPHKNVYAVGFPSNKFRFMGVLDDIDEMKIDNNAMLIVLDTPDIKRVDGVNINDFNYKIKIDHHPIIDTYADIELVDENSSSACQLILEFVLCKRLKMTSSIAENLYTGIVSDTGRFMHGYTSCHTFELVTKLLEKTNINFTKLYEPLYVRPLTEVRFQGYIFANLKITDSKVGYIKITDDILKKYEVDVSSAGNIIGEIQCINEILVWLFLTEDKKNNIIRTNIRSRGPAINEVASKYGGGGHKLASGVRLANWLDADNLIDDLNKVASDYKLS